MLRSWNPRCAVANGIVTEVHHDRDWTPADRHQRARIVLDGGRHFTLLGREPEERLFRRPRPRGVDRDEVASIRVGDEIELRHLDEDPARSVVTHLSILGRTRAGNPETDGHPIRGRRD